MCIASAIPTPLGRPMINGNVIPLDDPPLTGKPIIDVTVSNASERHRSLPFLATVDTGFTGFLTIRPDTIAQLGLPFITNQPAVLADGSISHCDVHVGSIFWHGRERVIPIYRVDSDPLAGMALLWNSCLTMDIVPNGPVTIVPL